MRPSSTGQWLLPTRIKEFPADASIYVRKCVKWPDFLTNLFPAGLVVSDRVARVFAQVPASQVQLFPLILKCPKRLLPAPQYWSINVSAVADASNLTASRVGNCVLPDSDRFFYENLRTTLDPGRVPTRYQVFTPRYDEGVIVRDDLAKEIKRLKPSMAFWGKVALKPETDADRRATLARLRKEARQMRAEAALKAPPVDSIQVLETQLALSLPARTARFLSTAEREQIDGHELFDISEAFQTTRELRDWKELAWPASMLAIGADGRGGYYAIDTTRERDGDTPVSYFDHELATIDKKAKEITPNFETCARSLDVWLRRLKRGGEPLLPLR